MFLCIVLAIYYGYDKLYSVTWKFEETTEFSGVKMGSTKKASSSSVVEGWSDDRQLTYLNNSNLPSIATDGRVLHLVWSDNRSGNYEIYYKKSVDNGRTWTEDKRLTNSQSHKAIPKIICFGNVLHIVWEDMRDGSSQVYYKRSEDGGETWTEDKRLSFGLDATEFPSITTTDGHNLYVVFIGRTTDVYNLYITTSTDNGNNWCIPYLLSTKTVCSDPWYIGGTMPNIISDKNGIHVFWTVYEGKNGEIYYKRSEDGGKTWSDEINLSNTPKESYGPYVVSDKDGLHLFYNENEEEPEEELFVLFVIYYRRSEDGGKTWTLPQRLTEVDNRDANVRCNPVSNNYGLHLIYTKANMPVKLFAFVQDDIYYKKSEDGGKTWSVEQRITYDGAEYPSFISLDNGVLCCVWRNIDYNDNYHLFYKFYDPTPPTGKPTKPVIDAVYNAQRSIVFSWGPGNSYDEESRFISYVLELWNTTTFEKEPQFETFGTIDNRKVRIKNLETGKTYRLHVCMRTETYRHTEWSEWSDFVTIESPLDNVIVYPNPARISSGQEVVTFDKISNDPVIIKIYNIAGEMVRTLIKDDTATKIEWDLKNERVSSGVYIYHMQIQGGTAYKTGKFAIIR